MRRALFISGKITPRKFFFTILRIFFFSAIFLDFPPFPAFSGVAI
jgi:hypothetical protein